MSRSKTKAIAEFIELLLGLISDMSKQSEVEDAVRATMEQVNERIAENPQHGVLVRTHVWRETHSGLKGPAVITIVSSGETPQHALKISIGKTFLDGPPKSSVGDDWRVDPQSVQYQWFKRDEHGEVQRSEIADPRNFERVVAEQHRLATEEEKKKLEEELRIQRKRERRAREHRAERRRNAEVLRRESEINNRIRAQENLLRQVKEFERNLNTGFGVRGPGEGSGTGGVISGASSSEGTADANVRMSHTIIIP